MHKKRYPKIVTVAVVSFGLIFAISSNYFFDNNSSSTYKYIGSKTNSSIDLSNSNYYQTQNNLKTQYEWTGYVHFVAHIPSGSWWRDEDYLNGAFYADYVLYHEQKNGNRREILTSTVALEQSTTLTIGSGTYKIYDNNVLENDYLIGFNTLHTTWNTPINLNYFSVSYSDLVSNSSSGSITQVASSDTADDGYYKDAVGTIGGYDELNSNWRLVYSLNANILEYTLYLDVTTINRGNGNVYSFANRSIGATIDSISSTAIVEQDTLENELSTGLSKNISIDSDYSPSLSHPENQTLINSAINVRLEEILSNYSYYWPNSSYFNYEVAYDENNNSSVTVITKNQRIFNNESTKTDSDGWITNSFNVPITLNLTDTYYSSQTYQRFLVDNELLDLANQSFSQNQSILDSPWYTLTDPPIYQTDSADVTTTETDGAITVSGTNYGTWRANRNLIINYSSVDNEIVYVNGIEIDSLNGQYEFKLSDNRSLASENETDTTTATTPTTYTIEIKGKKQDSTNLELLFSITFIIDALNSDFVVSYRGWDPDSEILDQWQQSWISPYKADGSVNADYKENLNTETGLANQLVWVSLKPSSENNYFEVLKANNQTDNQQNYNYYFSPDPISNDNEIIWSSLDSDATLSETKLNSINYGFIADTVMSPKGLKENFDSSLTVYRSQVDSNLNLIENTTELVNNADSSTPNELKYWDKSGLWKYEVYDSDNNTYSDFYAAIGTDLPFSSSFSTYINDLNSESNTTIIEPFWQSTAGQHLGDYLYKTVGLTQTEINELTYTQVMSWWKDYVKNAVLYNQNATYEKFDLSALQLDNIKINLTDVDAIKKYVQKYIQNQMNNLAKKITEERKADFAKSFPNQTWDEANNVTFTESNDYQLYNFDNLAWDSLLNQTSSIAELELTVQAIVPNNNLSGSKTIKIFNSAEFANIVDLNNISFASLNNLNTKSLTVLKQNIVDHVNATLSTQANLEVSTSDWYIKNEETVLNALLLDADNDYKSGTITVVATDSSTKLAGSNTIDIVNSSSNPFDLLNISFPTLNINSNSKAVIWQSIYQYVKSYMETNYENLMLDTDYQINITDSDIEQILANYNNNVKSYSINKVIIAKSDKVNNYTSLTVSNLSTNSTENNVTENDTNNPYGDASNPNNNGDNNNQSNNPVESTNAFFADGANIAWVSTLITITTLVLIVGGVFMHNRIKSNYGSYHEFFHRKKQKKDPKQKKPKKDKKVKTKTLKENK